MSLPQTNAYLALLGTASGADDPDRWADLAVMLCAEGVWKFDFHCPPPDYEIF